MRLPLFGLAVYASHCFATRLRRGDLEPVVKHSWPDVPKGWNLQGVPPADHPISLKIALKQGRIDDLIATLYEVSDPFNEAYGKYLTRL